MYHLLVIKRVNEKKTHCQNNSKISSYNLKNRGMINTTNTEIHGRLRAWRSTGDIHANPRETRSGRGSAEGCKMVHSAAFWI